MFALSWELHAAEDLRIGFDQRGLASITHRGVELMKPEDPRFRLHELGFTDAQSKERSRQLLASQPRAQSFDARKKVLTQEYDGFRVQCAYTTKENRLDMQITLANNTAAAIRQCVFFPLSLRLPHTVRNAGEWSRNAFLVDAYEHEKGTVMVTPVGYFYLRDGPHGARPLFVSGPAPENRPHHPLVDDAYWYDAGSPVLPGKTGSYGVSLVFGPPGATPQELCPEAYDEYAKAHPMEFRWPDRRPIATSFLCNPATGWKTNPRGYFQDPKVNVTTEEGLEAFGQRLLRYADDCIGRMKKMDAQGIIVWDIEGQEMPHMISYIGDPRQLPKLSPEMDRFSDAFMKKFRDAGFRTGITIRPTEIYRPNQAGRLAWSQRDVRDPLATMSEKIDYAQRRWGCTIFYLDSSVFDGGLLSEKQRKEMRDIPWVMPRGMFERLAKLHPDCLISPEFAERDHYRFGAPYSSPNLGDGGTDPLIRRLWPTAFRLVAVRQELMEKNWEHFAESVEKGDVLLFLPWIDTAENAFVQLLYREAAIRKGGALTLLAKADAATLAEKAGDPAEATRYAAATALGKAGTPAAVATLAGLLQDQSPLVRKQALAGLAQAKKIDDPACIALLGEWIKGSRDPIQNALRSQAADALARAGDAAVPALLGLLGDDKAAEAWPYAVRALGRTATADAKAGQTLIGWLNSKAPAKARLRNDVIESIGLLKVKDAVPSLLPILDKRDRQSESERGAAVVALGRIGDARAVEPLIKQFDVGYSTVVVYWIQFAIDGALRSITGQQNVVGRNEWLVWNQRRQAGQHRTP
jgi:HEAT repeat protein